MELSNEYRQKKHVSVLKRLEDSTLYILQSPKGMLLIEKDRLKKLRHPHQTDDWSVVKTGMKFDAEELIPENWVIS